MGTYYHSDYSERPTGNATGEEFIRSLMVIIIKMIYLYLRSFTYFSAMKREEKKRKERKEKREKKRKRKKNGGDKKEKKGEVIL